MPPIASAADHAPDRVLRALLWATAAGAAVLLPSLAYLVRRVKSMPEA
ncbi:MAG: hypothetical protein K8T90_21115 [Planctomycetes bacterium]|nr:hypothetical protein [Planctomycetota bacterium]